MMRHAVRTTIAVAALSFAVGLVACGGAEPPTAQAQDAPPPPAYVGEVGDLTSDQIDRQRRAEQGDASAQINLGVMYATARGVPQDDAEAVRWFRLAAEQGHATDQYNLGFRYDAGEGVPQDYVSAHMWLNLGVWGAMERKVRLATAVSGVSERPELAPSDRFRYGERVASQQVDVLVAER